MKKLWVIRHAKSSWKENGISDFERPLNKRGFLSAAFMGKILKQKGVKPELLVSSPALRAKTTAEIISEALNCQTLQFDKNIYEAHYRDLIGIINRLDDRYSSAMIFGHNPGLSDLVGYVTGEICQMVTCAVVEIDLMTDSWSACSGQTGTLVHYDFPKHYTEFLELIND